MSDQYPLKPETGKMTSSHTTNQLQKGFQKHAGYAQQQQMVLLEQIENIKIRQEGFLSRFSISKGEQGMLDTFWEAQNQALKEALQSRNNGLQIVGSAQTAFIREISNSLLLNAKAQLNHEKSVRYQQELLRMQQDLETLNRQFLDLITDKMEDAEKRPVELQKMVLIQIERMISHWDEQHHALLDHYAQLLDESV